VTAGLAKSNGNLPPGDDLKVTCGLTACTPGSAPAPTVTSMGELLPYFTASYNILSLSIYLLMSPIYEKLIKEGYNMYQSYMKFT